MKFRSVGVKFGKGGKRELKMFFDVSFCLKVYDFFFDSQVFLMGKKKPKRLKIKGYWTRRSVLEKFEFLDPYYFEEVLIGKDSLLDVPSWN